MVKNPPANAGDTVSISRRRKWQPTPAFLPGKSQGQRNRWGCKESDSTERITLEFRGYDESDRVERLSVHTRES